MSFESLERPWSSPKLGIFSHPQKDPGRLKPGLSVKLCYRLRTQGGKRAAQTILEFNAYPDKNWGRNCKSQIRPVSMVPELVRLAAGT